MKEDARSRFQARQDKLLEDKNANLVKSFEVPGHFTTIVPTLNRKKFISFGYRNIQVWDVGSFEMLDLEVDRDDYHDPKSVSITPNDKYIVSCLNHDDRPCIKLWDINSGKNLISIKESENPITGSITSDGDYFVYSTERQIKIVDFKTINNYLRDIRDKLDAKKEIKVKRLKPKIRKIIEEGARLLKITIDSKILLSLPFNENVIKIWDFTSGELINILKGHDEKINSIRISLDNKRILSCSDDTTIKIWDIHSGECIQTLKGHKEKVTDIFLSQDNQYLVSCAKDKVFVWDISKNHYIRTYSVESRSHSIAITGKYFIVGDYGDINIYNFITEPEPRFLTKIGIIPNEYQGVRLPKHEIALLMDIEVLIKKPIPNVEMIKWGGKNEAQLDYKQFNFGFFAEDGHIVELGLVKEYEDEKRKKVNNFDESIEILPESIGNLTHLRSLILRKVIFADSDNDYNGLPETFGNLTSLKYLDLSNLYIKTLPESFGNLKSLQTLDLRSTNIDKFPDSFGNLKMLETLHLPLFNLNQIPENIGDLESLKEFRIERSEKIEFLPESFVNLKNLEKIYIEKCAIKELPDSIGNLKTLKSLTLIKGSLKNLPESIGELTALEDLYLTDNLIETLPDSIGNLPSIKNINLSQNKLRLLPESLGNLKTLQNLNLSYNKNIERLPESFGNLTSLQNFGFAGNQNSKNLLEALSENFGNLVNLQNLNLNYNNLAELPKSFINLKSLQNLALNNNKRLSSLPESFDNLFNLTTLNIINCNFTEIPEILWRLKSLTELNMINNPLNPEESLVIQKTLQEIMSYIRKKSAIEIFISHAVVDFESYKIKQLSEFLEQKKEVYQAYYCESDLVGNIDDFMNDYLPRCQMVVFIASQKSVFNSPDCAHELDLARKMAIQIIPIKGSDVTWADLGKIGLDRELGMEFEMDNFDGFSEKLYHYVYDYKRNIDLFEDGMAKTLKKAHKKVIEEARVISVEENQVEAGVDKFNNILNVTGVNKLKNILKVSKALPIGRLAKILGMDEDKMWDSVFGWAQEFGFKINGEQLEFGDGRKDEFITELEKRTR